MIIASLPLLINNNVGAGTLNTRVVSPITKPYCKTQHISGAREPLEGYDGNGIDVLFNDMQFPPTIDIYSKVDFDPYRLKIDARPPESTSTFNLEISGRGLTAPENAVLEPKFSYYLGDNFW